MKLDFESLFNKLLFLLIKLMKSSSKILFELKSMNDKILWE